MLRATSSLVSFWCAVALAVFLLGDAGVRGRWDLVGRWLPIAAFVLWLLWLFLVRSSMTLTADRLVVTNLVRVHEIPWSRVDAVVDSPQVVVELDDGRRIVCWGAPFARRAGSAAGDSLGPVLGVIEARREAAPPSPDPAVRRWDLPVVIVGTVLAAVALSAVALP